MSHIGEALEREWHHIRGHLHHHRYDATSPKEAPAMSLIDTIEQDLTSAGHTVDQVAHDVLTHHLTLANIAAHVATETAAFAASPVARVVETAAGLTQAEQAFVARAAEDAAHWLDLAAGRAPLPDPVPAQ